MRIGANFLVRLIGERLQFGRRQAAVDDMQLHCEAEAAGLARADRDRAGRGRLARVLLMALGDEVERAAETGRIAGRKKMLRRRRPRLAWPAHRLRHGEVDADDPVFRRAVAVATASAAGRDRDERFDRRNHVGSFKAWDPFGGVESKAWSRPSQAARETNMR